MHLRCEMPYAAPPDAVFAMLADPEFRRAVCADQDVERVEVTITRDGPGMSVCIDQHQPTQGVPAFATAIIGATTHVIQLEEWADETTASLELKTPGKPATMHGTIEILPDGDGALEVVELEVKATVPFIGGRLERLMGDLVRRSIEAENVTGAAWLAGERR
ncbi:MAG: DUF2505 domain-containing protein [Nocardioides sp.]